MNELIQVNLGKCGEDDRYKCKNHLEATVVTMYCR